MSKYDELKRLADELEVLVPALLREKADLIAENERLSAQIADPEFPPKYSRRLIAQLRAEIESLKEASHV